MTDFDLLVVGSGIAGLTAVLRTDPALRVGVVAKGPLDRATTTWAQGGVAAVLDTSIDSTEAHLADTIAAGGGLCDVDAVRVLVDEGPDLVRGLDALGVRFDRDEQGRLQFAREGGHSAARIVHAGGAATGAELERALVRSVRSRGVTIHEHAFAVDLLVEHGRCVGVRTLLADGTLVDLRAQNVVLAAGGAGQMYAVTTTPLGSTGDGIAMALRAGAAVADLEFVQFHPTALHHDRVPKPLLSEALRGHGALIVDVNGERFVDELLPRDQVSRAITTRMNELGVDHCLLDVRGLSEFSARFPTIAAVLAEVGLDPSVDLLPIAPAAHYLCGGVLTDLDGATSLPGLWAAGEVACSGVHGANRLASNSLLEGLVFGARVIDAIGRGVDSPSMTGAMRALHSTGPSWRAPALLPVDPVAGATIDVDGARRALQQAMTLGAGVVRDADSLAATAAVVGAIDGLPSGVAGWEVANLRDVASALLIAAAARTETRGAHVRRDFPSTDPDLARRLVLV